MRILPLLAPLLLSIGSSSTARQESPQTFIADNYGRPGSQFTEIQPAIDAASSGDTILVRPLEGIDTYRAFLLQGKGLSILGEPGVRVAYSTRGKYMACIRIQAIPLGEVAVLRDLEAAVTGLYTALAVEWNQGSVHGENLLVAGETLILHSPQLSFRDSRFTFVKALNSTVLMSRCAVTASNPSTTGPATGAFRIRQGSRVTLAGGTYFGSGVVGVPLQNGSPAFALDPDARLVVTGDFDTVLQAGVPTPTSSPTEVIASLGGEIVLDPDPMLIPGLNAPGISGPANLITVRVPYLHTDVSGGVLTTTVETFPGATVRLYYGAFAAPVPYRESTPDIWVPTPKRIVNAVAPADGIRIDTFTLPALPAGSSYPLQAVVLYQGEVYLSNPVVTILGE